MKKVLSALLCMVLLFSAIPLGTITVSAASYSGTCGDNITWSLDTETGVLDITGSGAMTNYYNWSSVPWYSYQSSVKTVNIGNGVTSIGSYAFYGCSSLTDVTIPNTVKSIGDLSFYGCTGLVNVIIPDSVTSIGRDAFNRCSNITDVTIGSGITAVGCYSFEACYKLKYNIYDNAKYLGNSVNPYLVLIMGASSDIVSCDVNPNTILIADCAFYDDYRKLESINISDSVKYIGNSAFTYCTGLTSVTIPDSVKLIGEGAFSFCDGLKSAVIGSGVDSFDYAFDYCIGLINVAIKSGVKCIGNGAFEDCSSLAAVTIPNSVVSIKDWAFLNCTNIKTVYYDGTAKDRESIDILGGNEALLNAEWIYKGETPEVIDSGKCGDNLTWSIDKKGTLTISGKGEMYDYSFEAVSPWSKYSTQIKLINICNGVTSIGACAFPYIFSFSSLEKIVLPETLICMDGSSFVDIYNYDYKIGPIGSNSEVEYGWKASIPDEALCGFYGCPKLLIPKNITNLGLRISDAKYDRIYYSGTQEQWNKFVNNSETQGDVFEEAEVIFVDDCFMFGHQYDNDDDNICNVCGHSRAISCPESEHDYESNSNESWTIHKTGALSISVTFSYDTFTEPDYDFIYIYDENGTLIGQYSGNSLAGKTIVVSGNTVLIALISNEYVNGYGFTVSDIRFEMADIGDGNGDGKTDAEDLTLLTNAIINGAEYNGNLDINGNGSLDILDIIALKKLLADNPV